MTHSPGPWVAEPIDESDRRDEDGVVVDLDQVEFLIAEQDPRGDVLATVLGLARRGTPADNARLLAGADSVPHECEVPDCPGAALLRLMAAAAHALRSYQYGNAAPDLAAEVAGPLEAAVAAARQVPR